MSRAINYGESILEDRERDLNGTIQAAEICVAFGEYDNAELALLDALGRVRQKQGKPDARARADGEGSQ